MICVKIAVCDDELRAAGQIRDMALRVFDDISCDVFTEVEALLGKLEEGEEYSAILMDIEWDGKEKGIRAAERIKYLGPDIRIIYVTGFTEKYVQQIFFRPANLSGFLIKPVTEYMLRRALEKALADQKRRVKDKFTFQQGGSLHSIAFYKILYLESSAHKIMITTRNETFYCYGKLDEIAEKFPPNFIRCHKSYLVNMDEIQEFGHGYMIMMSDRRHIPIAKIKHGMVKKAYFEYMKADVFEKKTD